MLGDAQYAERWGDLTVHSVEEARYVAAEDETFKAQI